MEIKINFGDKESIKMSFDSLSEFEEFIKDSDCNFNIPEDKKSFVKSFIEDKRIKFLMEYTYACESLDEVKKIVIKKFQKDYLNRTYPIGGEVTPEISDIDANYYSLPDGTFKFRDKIYDSINSLINDKSNAYKGNKFGKDKLSRGEYAVHHYWDISFADFISRYNSGTPVAGVTPGRVMDVDHSYGLLPMYRKNYLNLFGVDENHIKFDYEVIHYPDESDKRMFIRYGLDVLQLKS